MTSSNESASEVRPDWFGEPDARLQLLVAVLNANPSVAFHLTLTVGGTLITGTAVGAAAYWQLAAEQDEENRSGLRDYFLDALEMTVQSMRDERPSISDVTFIHLVDCAHWVSADACIPADRRANWRGRLSEVQGWTLGRVGDSPEPSSVVDHQEALRQLQKTFDEIEASRPADLEDQAEPA